MSTRHLVDPELLTGLDNFPILELSPDMLKLASAGVTEMSRQQREAAPPSPVVAEERHAPGSAGAPDVRMLVYTPPGTEVKAGYLHIHGGGYVLGAADMSEVSNMALAEEIGAVVVSVDYRLAPGTPHPGPVEDCYAALKWLHANAAALGVDPGRIAIGGESAGGGLAAALALLARDRGEVPIIFQRLIYPMIDDRTVVTETPNRYTGEFVWTVAHNRFGWRSLLGQEPGGPDISPYAAAARAKDLEGLPPAYIAVGALDLFLDENLDYATRLLRAGVPTELHVYPGAYHGFQIATEAADVVKRSERDALAALKRALAG